MLEGKGHVNIILSCSAMLGYVEGYFLWVIFSEQKSVVILEGC
jgi:hypothetical protein